MLKHDVDYWYDVLSKTHVISERISDGADVEEQRWIIPADAGIRGETMDATAERYGVPKHLLRTLHERREAERMAAMVRITMHHGVQPVRPAPSVSIREREAEAKRTEEAVYKAQEQAAKAKAAKKLWPWNKKLKVELEVKAERSASRNKVVLHVGFGGTLRR